jgi:hypothetical protein
MLFLAFKAHRMNRPILGLGLLLFFAQGCGDSTSSPTPTSISVSPGVSTVNAIGETAQFSATLRDQKGNAIPDAVFTWSSSNDQVASVTSSGTATGLTAGSAFIRASAEGISGSATLNIDPLPQALEKISGDLQDGALNQVLPIPITVEARDANGYPIQGKFVSFSVLAGEGSASPVQFQTGSDGRASTTWRLGCSNDNPQRLRAGVGGLSVEFAANVDLSALAICETEIPEGRETLSYGAQLSAVGGDQGSLSWSVVGGGVPPGLTLQPSGSLEGTPTLRGQYQFEARVQDGAGASAFNTYALRVCDAPVLLNPGQSATFAPDGPDGCGFFIPTGNAGDRYRFGVVYAQPDTASGDVQTVTVEMNREAGGAVAPPAAADLQAWMAPSSSPKRRLSPQENQRLLEELERAETTAEFHMKLRRAEDEWLRSMGPNFQPLPDRSGPALALASGPARAAPEKRTFTNPVSYGGEDGCTLKETVRAIKIAENDVMVIYQDSVQWESDRLSTANAQQMLDFYAASGPQIIDGYFGGITDINGDGQVVVFVTPEVEEGVIAFVYSADFFPKTDEVRGGVTWLGCEASNEMEMMRFNHDVIKRIPSEVFSALGATVHEVKHISSVYKSIIRNQGLQPGWIEEGTAEIAQEMASRLLWANAGGPAVGAMATGSQLGTWTQDNYAVVSVTAGAVRYLSSQPNGVVATPEGADQGHSIYGSGWHFHRWLGDAYGGAATGPLADSALFRALNDSLTALGVEGILEVTGAPSWGYLMEEYLAAIMLNGTGAPQGTRAITTYEFPTTTEIFRTPNPTGSYPWAVNAVVGADDLSLPAPFLSTTNVGLTGPSGVRIFDVASDGTGLGLEVLVTAGPAASPFRIVLVRVE